jgi:hypothetical protein
MFAALTKPVAPGLYTLRLAPSPPHLIYMRFASSPTRRASLRNVAPLVRWNYGSVERYALNDRTG